MVKKYSIAEARDNLASVVHEAEEGAQVELTRRGKPVAVLIGVEDFERRLSKEKPGFRAAYEKFRREHNLAELDIDPDEIFGDVRDPSPGRDFNW
ncbi:MAG: type II toxin-antitoxin system Phd/YefM family antitoxin [Acidobacteria bacterium]|nr:type II toxin-antitoxin system Phd/YefM family antitoxin [Acidobacteriota bacterium]